MTGERTMAECVAAGGHYWAAGARGIVGELAEHDQHCPNCPAGRMGYIHTHHRDSQMQWGEPYNRIDGPWPWRELTAEELRQAAEDLSQ
ncbi:MAG: hypothetical protein ACRDRO_23475 [Pseudonocardiaceae bacterium]